MALKPQHTSLRRYQSLIWSFKKVESIIVSMNRFLALPVLLCFQQRCHLQIQQIISFSWIVWTINHHCWLKTMYPMKLHICICELSWRFSPYCNINDEHWARGQLEQGHSTKTNSSEDSKNEVEADNLPHQQIRLRYSYIVFAGFLQCFLKYRMLSLLCIIQCSMLMLAPV